MIDDEVLSLNALKWELDRLAEDIEIVGSSTDPSLGLALIKEKKPDIVFLDIEMPNINGLELLNRLDVIDFQIVFTTAYDEYAIKAIKYSATDYLLKPIQHSALVEAVIRCKTETVEGMQKRFLKLYEYLSDKDQLDKLILPTQEGLEFISNAEIIRLESDSNYTTVYRDNGERCMVAKTLKYVHDLLNPKYFIRVHKSHIINVEKIKKYVKADGGYLIMTNDDVVPISRNKKSDFFAGL